MNSSGKNAWATRWWTDLHRTTRWWIAIGLLGAVVIAGGVYGYRVYSHEKEVDDVTEFIKDTMKNPMDPTVSQEQRREQFQQVQQKMEGLNQEQQTQVRNNMMKAMKDVMTKPIREYFLIKDPQERTAYLDKQIDQMEVGRKQFEEMRKKREAERAKNPNANQGPPQGQNPGQNQAQGQRGPGGPGGPGRGPGGPASPEQREQWRRNYLDNTTPQERAQFAEYMEAVRKRREERGLPAMRGPFGR